MKKRFEDRSFKFKEVERRARKKSPREEVDENITSGALARLFCDMSRHAYPRPPFQILYVFSDFWGQCSWEKSHLVTFF